MRSETLDATIAAANPFPAPAQTMPIARTCEALLATLAQDAAPKSRPARVPATPRWVRASTRVRRRLALSLAALVLAACLLAVALTGEDSSTGGTQAYAAVLVRYARNSPLVLLARRGWRVADVIEMSASEGEMSFTPAGRSETAGAAAQLYWQLRPMTLWPGGTTSTVLGVRAHVYRDGSGPLGRTYVAVWRYRGQSISFRATVADLRAFLGLLAALRPVSEGRWLAALPARVITAAERPSVIKAMLAGIPLPPGFEVSRLQDQNLTDNRYQVGAAVTGTVACLWLKSWAEGRREGNPARVRAAVAAMASAVHWPVLHEMERSGGYPGVLREYAADMASGRWLGHPLAAAANSGLGCDQHGDAIP